MNEPTAYCTECHNQVEVEEVKIKHSVSGPEKVVRTSIGIDCGHTIYDKRPSTPEESKNWSLTKKVTFSLREKELIDEVKGREEPANEFLHRLVRYIISNRTRFRDFKDWRKSYNFPPIDFSEENIPSDKFHDIS